MFNHLFYRHIADDQERRVAMLRDEALDEGLAVEVYEGGVGVHLVRLQPLGTSARSHPGYQGTATTGAEAIAKALTRARDDRGRT